MQKQIVKAAFKQEDNAILSFGIDESIQINNILTPEFLSVILLYISPTLFAKEAFRMRTSELCALFQASQSWHNPWGNEQKYQGMPIPVSWQRWKTILPHTVVHGCSPLSSFGLTPIKHSDILESSTLTQGNFCLAPHPLS